jgi:hypothetical protein
MNSRKKQDFNLMMKNMVIVSNMLKDYGLTIFTRNSSLKREHRPFVMCPDRKIIIVPKTFDYTNDNDLFSICHEIGHYIDKLNCYRSYKKDSWIKVIKSEITAWKLGRKEYIKYFGKDITQDLKDMSIFYLLCHIGYQKVKYAKKQVKKEAENLVEKGKAKSLKLAIRELSYKIPNIRTIAQWNEVLDTVETSKMKKHLRKILGY